MKASIKLLIVLIGVITLGYFFYPMDLVPDAIPLAGQIDDAIVGLVSAIVAAILWLRKKNK